MNKDLTVGKPSQVLWQFCLPMFGSIIFQQLYNIADSLVAGKFIGENALAAVGNSYEITLIFIAFAFGCNIGCSVIVSRYFGAKEYDDMKTSVYTALIGSAVLCAVLMVFGLLGCRSLLELINTPEEILADSALYLDIYVLGLPFMFFYNIATGIFSALGDSKTPFYFLAVSSLSNIGVDILFVAGFQMGVAGVAWATFLCQGVSCVLAMVVVFRRMKAIPTDRKTVWFSWNMLGKIAVVAIPSILQQSFISVGNIILQSVINTFGASVIAGYSAAVKLNNMVITSFTTLGNGISNYTSQNMGAGKMDRVKAGFGAGRNLVWLICVPIVILYFFFGRTLLLLFMNDPQGPASRYGYAVPAHPFALLLCGVPQAGHRRHPARLRPDGPLHGGYLHGPDPPGGHGHRPQCYSSGQHRHLAVLAHWLVHRHGPVPGVLRHGHPQGPGRAGGSGRGPGPGGRAGGSGRVCSPG